MRSLVHGPSFYEWFMSHLSWRFSMVSLSRALRCLIDTSFCCSGVRYCSGGGGRIPWLSLQEVYFMWRLIWMRKVAYTTYKQTRKKRKEQWSMGELSLTYGLGFHHCPCMTLNCYCCWERHFHRDHGYWQVLDSVCSITESQFQSVTFKAT